MKDTSGNSGINFDFCNPTIYDLGHILSDLNAVDMALYDSSHSSSSLSSASSLPSSSYELSYNKETVYDIYLGDYEGYEVSLTIVFDGAYKFSSVAELSLTRRLIKCDELVDCINRVIGVFPSSSVGLFISMLVGDISDNMDSYVNEKSMLSVDLGIVNSSDLVVASSL